MLKSLHIQNFKRFRELNFSQLKRVNLIAGKNNTGKTGVLEALFLWLNIKAANELLFKFRNSKSIEEKYENFWRWQFTDKDITKNITITADTDYQQQHTVLIGRKIPELGFYDEALLPGTLKIGWQVKKQVPDLRPSSSPIGGVAVIPTLSSDPQQEVQVYDRVVLKAGGEERLQELLRKVEPRLRSIRSIRPFGETLLYVDIGLPEKIPAVHLGQGFTRLLSIYAQLIAGDAKVLLIDEIENGLHHSILPEIWRGLQILAEQEKVQVFATTHSYECIRAAHKVFADTPDYDFALHRLEEIKGDVTVITYDKETLETSLISDFEVR